LNIAILENKCEAGSLKKTGLFCTGIFAEAFPKSQTSRDKIKIKKK